MHRDRLTPPLPRVVLLVPTRGLDPGRLRALAVWSGLRTDVVLQAGARGGEVVGGGEAEGEAAARAVARWLHRGYRSRAVALDVDAPRFWPAVALAGAAQLPLLATTGLVVVDGAVLAGMTTAAGVSLARNLARGRRWVDARGARHAWNHARDARVDDGAVARAHALSTRAALVAEPLRTALLDAVETTLERLAEAAAHERPADEAPVDRALRAVDGAVGDPRRLADALAALARA